MSAVIDFQTIKQEYKRKDISTRKQIKQLLLRFALEQCGHGFMWSRVKQLMVTNGLTHLRLPKQNLEIWFKKGMLVFDIINDDAISVDECCPFCGNNYYKWSTILYIHPGLNHERHVYACSCGRFYTVLWDKDEDDK